MEKAVDFYKKVLGVRVIVDFGANKTLTGGICLETLNTWKNFKKNGEEIIFKNNAMEIYFEEDDMNSFLKKIETFKDIKYVHKVEETSCGQRTVAFYDVDFPLIKVGENKKVVAKRFLNNGMSK